MKKVVFYIVVLLSVNACVSLPNLDNRTLPLAEHMDAEIHLNQTELEVISPNTGSAGGGIIGAIISSAINNAEINKAEKAIGVVRNALITSNTENEILDIAKTKLAASAIATQMSIESFVFDEIPDPMRLPVLAEENQFTVRLSYKLTSKLDRLIVSARVNWYDVSVDSFKGKEKRKYDNHYYGSYVFITEAPETIENDDSSRREEFAKAWVSLGGEAIHQLIVQGVVDVMDMLLLDIGSLGKPALTSDTVRFKSDIENIRFRGYVLKERGDYLWIKRISNATQSYYSINRDAVKFLSK